MPPKLRLEGVKISATDNVPELFQKAKDGEGHTLGGVPGGGSVEGEVVESGK